MEIDARSLSQDATYKLMIGSVVPRPIAWLTTISPSGLVNAAPFSAYTMVSTRPAIVIVNCARRAGVSKDTARNAEATGGFVLNVVSEDLASLVHKTATVYPPDVSETDALGIELIPSRRVCPPRIAVAPVNLECKLLQILEFGEEHDQNLVGEVVYFHIRDSIFANGKIDQTRLRPLARLGGPTYARLGEFITMPVETPAQ
ncbi:MAG TPA: flavin reductase family protein [Stellaceae bacterium]|nr:flavin reductase family protein [Stellaceae bacterium]